MATEETPRLEGGSDVGRPRGRWFLALLAATVLCSGLLLRIDAGLKNAAAPLGIVSFELARTVERAEEVLDSWRPEANGGEDRRPWAEASLWLDLPYLLLYPAALFLACRWMARRDAGGRIGRRIVGWGRFVCWLPVAAGAADMVENLALWNLLEGVTRVAAGVAFGAASLKFGLLGLAFAYLLSSTLVLGIARQREEPLIQYLYYCRFPLLVALVLVLLGPVSAGPASSLLGSLFLLEGAFPALVVAGLALLAVWTVLLTLRLILRYGWARFGDAPPRGVLPWLERQRPWLAGSLVTPLLLTAAFVSNQPESPGAPVWRQVAPGTPAFFLGTALGLGLAVLFLAGARRLQEHQQLGGWDEAIFRFPWERPPEPPGASPGAEAFALPAPNREPPPLLQPYPALHQGYLEPHSPRLLPGHRYALQLLGLTASVYILAFLPLRPDGALADSLRFPALGYLMWVFLAVGWSLPGVSFFFDRLRVPVLLALVALVAVMHTAFRADHYYAAAGRVISPLDPLTALRARDAALAGSAERPAIAVAASGGGIRAALWTAQVLTGLHELGDAGSDTAPWRGVRLISSVSGGSVGTLHYLDALEAAEARGAALDAAALAQVRDAAAANGLPATAWGIAYPDLWRVFGGFAFRIGGAQLDRGWALEQVWRRHLAARDATLGDWRDAVAAGRLPAPVLNATVVEDGSPLPLTPLSLPSSWGVDGPFDAARALDLPATTAARLSATFPWVTPIARGPRRLDVSGAPDGPAWAPVRALAAQHLADGGYYDNFGVFSTVHWVRDLLQRPEDVLRTRGVILVVIRASDPCAPPRKTAAGASRGWVYATLGPLLALNRVRTSTQLARNRIEVELLSELLRATGVPSTVVEFPLRAEGPLSWKLTRRERRRIADAWSPAAPEARRLARCYADMASCPESTLPTCPGGGSGS